MDEHGIIVKNVAGLYARDSRDSEQVSQTIMGQRVRIERHEDDWLYVETWDSYHGWIENRWVTSEYPGPERPVTVTALFTDALLEPHIESDILTKLVITTELEFLDTEKEFTRVRLPDGAEMWVASRDVTTAGLSGQRELPLVPSGADLVRTAGRFLGIPYLWGGTTPFGLDCSGFVQLVYRIHGISLLRDAYMQTNDPRAIDIEKAELASGDLVFFTAADDRSKITHVGIARDGRSFIHSAGGAGVTVNRLDDTPYNRSYWGARRLRED